MQLDRRRLTAYPRLFLALYLAIGAWWIAGGSGRLDRSGKPVGVDFVTFYAASLLAARGDAPAVWDLTQITATEREVIGADIPPFAFHYPPTFLLGLWPLALFPYLAALIVWWVGSVAAFVTVAKRLAPHALTAGLALSFPGLFQNVVQGQNGAFTAAILGAGLMTVDRRPAVAGALLGLLSYKPQWLPLVWLGLVAGRRWRALAASLACAAVLAASSLAIFGVEAWHAFLRNVPFAVEVLESKGVLPWFRMPTVQVQLMLWGLPVGVARGAQAVAAATAAAAVAIVWARSAPLPVRATVVTCGTLLFTPFAFDYDLAVLAVPIALLAFEGSRTGFHTGDVPVLALAWLAPLLAPAIAEHTSIQITPILLLALMGVAVRAWRLDRAPARPREPNRRASDQGLAKNT